MIYSSCTSPISGPQPASSGTQAAARTEDHWLPRGPLEEALPLMPLPLPVTQTSLLAPPADVEPQKETKNAGRNWKRQEERQVVDDGPGQAGPPWVSSRHIVLEEDLTFSLVGLRSGVTVKMLMSTGRKRGVWQFPSTASPPTPARAGRPPRCLGLYTGLSV